MIVIYKSCSYCGKVHDINYKCNKKPKINWSKYNKDSDEYKLRNTYNWHKKAEEIKQRANYICEVCKDKNIKDRSYNVNYEGLEVHHINKLSNRPDLLLDNYNLICLCVKHHKEADRDEIDKDYLFKLAKDREDKC